jgi:hypothetical protein
MVKTIDENNSSKQKPQQPEHKTGTSVKNLRQLKAKTRRNKKMAATFLVIFIIGLLLVGLLLKNMSADPFPKSVRQAVSFPLYYPSKLPRGYVLDKKSVKTQNSIVFYTINNGNKKIFLSEQAAPAHPPDLRSLTKAQASATSPSGFTPSNSSAAFREVETPLGQAVQGTSLVGTSVAIVIADNTLINLSGTNSLPSNVLTQAIQNLKQQ